jgi:hypothetical protein
MAEIPTSRSILDVTSILLVFVIIKMAEIPYLSKYSWCDVDPLVFVIIKMTVISYLSKYSLYISTIPLSFCNNQDGENTSYLSVCNCWNGENTSYLSVCNCWNGGNSFDKGKRADGDEKWNLLMIKTDRASFPIGKRVLRELVPA